MEGGRGEIGERGGEGALGDRAVGRWMGRLDGRAMGGDRGIGGQGRGTRGADSNEADKGREGRRFGRARVTGKRDGGTSGGWRPR